MEKKITKVFSYTEENNPYADGETISVSLVEDANYNKYIEIDVYNDVENGCSIFLTKDQITDLIQKLNSAIY